MAELELNTPPADERPKLGWGYLGPVMLTCGGGGEMPAARFDTWIADMKRHEFDYVLGSTVGRTSINSVQRRQVVEALGHKRRVIVIVENRVMRGILTALDWLGLKVKSYDWPDIHRAATDLGAPGVEPAALAEALIQLREQTTGQDRSLWMRSE